MTAGRSSVGGGGQAGQGPTSAVLHVRDQKASGAAGGSSATGTWNVRTLNTVKVNEIEGASLAANAITLPGGSYTVDGYGCAYAVLGTKVRLRDTTGGVTLVVGAPGYARGTDSHAFPIPIHGFFSLSIESVVQFQHYTQTAVPDQAWGLAIGAGEVEVYADLLIRKVA